MQKFQRMDGIWIVKKTSIVKSIIDEGIYKYTWDACQEWNSCVWFLLISSCDVMIDMRLMTFRKVTTITVKFCCNLESFRRYHFRINYTYISTEEIKRNMSQSNAFDEFFFALFLVSYNIKWLTHRQSMHNTIVYAIDVS